MAVLFYWKLSHPGKRNNGERTYGLLPWIAGSDRCKEEKTPDRVGAPAGSISPGLNFCLEGQGAGQKFRLMNFWEKRFLSPARRPRS
ncbi:MAG: hypothetical protein D6715_14795 [Calditrichaeota bacterium]|nr:MAG: hypothetical protein D6715_14795 [Calditrichota bacterium]